MFFGVELRSRQEVRSLGAHLSLVVARRSRGRARARPLACRGRDDEAEAEPGALDVTTRVGRDEASEGASVATRAERSSVRETIVKRRRHQPSRTKHDRADRSRVLVAIVNRYTPSQQRKQRQGRPELPRLLTPRVAGIHTVCRRLSAARASIVSVARERSCGRRCAARASQMSRRVVARDGRHGGSGCIIHSVGAAGPHHRRGLNPTPTPPRRRRAARAPRVATPRRRTRAGSRRRSARSATRASSR